MYVVYTHLNKDLLLYTMYFMLVLEFTEFMSMPRAMPGVPRAYSLYITV
jgi:hypothetical protein